MNQKFVWYKLIAIGTCRGFACQIIQATILFSNAWIKYSCEFSMDCLMCSGNNVGDEGASALGDALRVNTTLMSLDLTCECWWWWCDAACMYQWHVSCVCASGLAWVRCRCLIFLSKSPLDCAQCACARVLSLSARTSAVCVGALPIVWLEDSWRIH